MDVIYLPPVEKITVGIFEDGSGEIFQVGEWYPAIVLLYGDEITKALIRLMVELDVTKKDLFVVNFEKLKEKTNVVVCFRIKRGKNQLVLVAEVEIGDKSVNDFKKYFQKTKRFTISFGFYRPDDVISLASIWHVLTDSYTEYDEKSLHHYLSGEYH